MSSPTEDVSDICDRLASAVLHYGNRTALEFDTQRWTYDELDCLCDGLARYIQQQASAPDSIVVIDCGRSALLVMSILACVKAGLVFFVLAENQPEPYIARALENIKRVVWLGSEDSSDRQRARRIVGDRLSSYSVLGRERLANLHATERGIGRRVVPAVVPCGAEGRGLYLVATSGTTGRPKLVLTSESPILNFIDWYQETFSLSYKDKFSMLSGLGYDPLIRDILVPLCIGACVSVPTNEVLSRRNGLHAWIDSACVSVIHATPQLAKLIFPQAETRQLGSVRLMAIGGSTLSRGLASHIKLLLPEGSLVNVYGATETPQIMSYYVVDHAPYKGAPCDGVPVGKPIRAVDIRVFDEEGKPASGGEVGEIYILTRHLAVGYYLEPDLTREKFVLDEVSDNRAYRTGDLGYIDRDGNLHFVGRKDRQVKHRGYRIQLEEIEQAMVGLGGVVAAAVLYEDLKGDPAGVGKIVCYVEARPGTFFDKVEVKQKLAGVLPAYMMPDGYVVLEKMPFNSRHKIDYTALKSALAVSDSLSKSKAGLSMQNSLVAKELLSMWAEVLGRPPTSISLDKNFFDIGGNSLLSVALIKHINAAFSKNLKITDLYIYSNINELSRHISHESEILGQPELNSNVSRRADNLNKMRTMRNRRDGAKL